GLDGQELQVTPEARWPCLDPRPAGRRADDRSVVHDLERAETGGADVGRTERFGGATVPAGEADHAPRRPVAIPAADGARGRLPLGWCYGIDRHRRHLAVRGGSTTRCSPRESRDPPCAEGSTRGAFPYLAGGPARIWHLAGSTPVGCRGFNGPVPPPLLIKRSSVVRGA